MDRFTLNGYAMVKNEDGAWARVVDMEAKLAKVKQLEDDFLKMNNLACELRERAERAERERDDARHGRSVAMHDIAKACEGTTARSACEVVELWRKERDAQAEAVRVLGGELFKRCFLGYDKAWGESEIAKIANPLARAAVKGGE